MKKYPIIIDPEFRSLIPPMSADERAQLKKNIRQHGLRDRIVLWKQGAGTPSPTYTIIDGHSRWEILQELAAAKEVYGDRVVRQGLPSFKGDTNDYFIVEFTTFRYTDGTLHGDERDRVRLWILENQIGRRNLTKEQRIEMVAKIVLLRQEQSAVASKANLKQGDKTPDVTETVPSGKRTVAAAAREFDVPREPLQKAVNKAKGKPAPPPKKKTAATPHHVDLTDEGFEFLEKLLQQMKEVRAQAASKPKSKSPDEKLYESARMIIKLGRIAAALKFHPDRGGDTEMMALLNQAASWLETLIPKAAPKNQEAA